MKTEEDPLKQWFGTIPDESLPDTLRSQVMQQVFAEAKRQQRRCEWFGYLLAGLGFVALIAVLVVLYTYMDYTPQIGRLEIPSWTLRFPPLYQFAFPFYIGTLALLLLVLDYKIRQHFHKEGSL